ncbi:shugoshin Sgo1 [Schizosaccharomyces japonicus yFS275]|uniref:Shugoshin Sgo1 n=1 Tax=Schizosaccharomyces japonicus (strain yFS275 / FY16936) TaxID=402676 RepID=B6K5L3_SCHJY|nr:shugoshin Sgo1 [Schizosaccharomyces japonicus yFS275]EEB08817.1 shugoshin Sgo1 [Schizosaccharomyces japonicus yFS275]
MDILQKQNRDLANSNSALSSKIRQLENKIHGFMEESFELKKHIARLEEKQTVLSKSAALVQYIQTIQTQLSTNVSSLCNLLQTCMNSKSHETKFDAGTHISSNREEDEVLLPDPLFSPPRKTNACSIRVFRDNEYTGIPPRPEDSFAQPSSVLQDVPVHSNRLNILGSSPKKRSFQNSPSKIRSRRRKSMRFYRASLSPKRKPCKPVGNENSFSSNVVKAPKPIVCVSIPSKAPLPQHEQLEREEPSLNDNSKNATSIENAASPSLSPKRRRPIRRVNYAAPSLRTKLRRSFELPRDRKNRKRQRARRARKTTRDSSKS